MALGKHKQSLSLKRVACALIALVVVTSIIIIYNRLFLITHYELIVDSLLTNETQIAIEQHLQHSNWRRNPHELTKTLSDRFACIKKVSTQILPPSLLRITIEAEQPTLAVNNRYVITHSGKVIPDHSFLRHRVIMLPHIRMRTLSPDAPLLSNELKICLAHLTPQLLTSYAITIESETTIWLNDMNTPIDILTSVASMPDHTMIAQCNRVVQSLTPEEESPTTDTAERWIADIRFNKQIIVSKKGGHNHG